MTALYYGPLNKSIYTQLLELIVKCILHADENIRFKYKQNPDTSTLYVTINNLTINLSLLMTKADFSHIRFNKEDSDKYVNIMGSSGLRARPEDRNNLTEAEKHAIKSYTGIKSSSVNDLLYHNKVNWFDSLFTGSPKKRLLHATMLASALNKVQPKKGRRGYRLYRGENYVSRAEIEERTRLVRRKGVSAQLAFYSTTSSKEVAHRFAHKSMIVFKNPMRKPIKSYSYFRHEREYLQLPGHIQWVKHTLKNGLHKFYAKIVEPFIRQKSPSPRELAHFKALVTWARSKRVNLDFLTPSALKLISTRRLPIERKTMKGTPIAALQGAFRGANVRNARVEQNENGFLSTLKSLSSFLMKVSGIAFVMQIALLFVLFTPANASALLVTMPETFIYTSVFAISAVTNLFCTLLLNKNNVVQPVQPENKAQKRHEKQQRTSRHKKAPTAQIKPQAKGIYHLRTTRNRSARNHQDEKSISKPKRRIRSA